MWWDQHLRPTWTGFGRIWMNVASLTVLYQLWLLRIWTFVSYEGLWVFVWDCFRKTLFCSNIAMLPCQLCKSSSIGDSVQWLWCARTWRDLFNHLEDELKWTLLAGPSQHLDGQQNEELNTFTLLLFNTIAAALHKDLLHTHTCCHIWPVAPLFHPLLPCTSVAAPTGLPTCEGAE